MPRRPAAPEDVLVTWNTYGNNAALATGFRRSIICEEAYIRRVKGERHFAIGLNGHNGQGDNPIGAAERWHGWNISVAPWRDRGGHILVCGQRGFGYNQMAMPDDWPDRVYARLRAVTDRPIWYRPHPKRRRRMPTAPYDRIVDYAEPLAVHLASCWAVVVYTSNAATDALLSGVPAFYDGPDLITAAAAQPEIAAIEAPRRGDRQAAFTRIAWSQWSVPEIIRGDPFARLLAT